MAPRRDDDSDFPAPPVPSSYDQRALERASHAKSVAEQALEVARSAGAGVKTLLEDVEELKACIGYGPSPGRPGAGLVGVVLRLEAQLERLVEARVAATPLRRRAPKAVYAGVAGILLAIGTATGTVISAARGERTTEHEARGAKP